MISQCEANPGPGRIRSLVRHRIDRTWFELSTVHLTNSAPPATTATSIKIALDMALTPRSR